MPVEPAAAGALITELTRRLEAVRHNHFTGKDDGGLVEASVDGDGLIAKVTFHPGISRHRPADVSQAILDAIDAAQAQLMLAYSQVAELAAEWEQDQ